MLKNVVGQHSRDREKTQNEIWSLEALNNWFGEKLVVFLDRARYIYTRDLWEHVNGNRATETVGDRSVASVHGDNLNVWHFPPELPELNPLEGHRDWLEEWFKHRLVPDLPTSNQQIQRGLPTVEEPNIRTYLCP